MAAGDIALPHSSGPKWVLRPYSQKQLDERVAAAANAMRALMDAADLLVGGLAPFRLEDAAALKRGDAAPRTVVAALRNYIDVSRYEPDTMPSPMPDVMSLSALWTEQFRLGLGWKRYEMRAPRSLHQAIASPNRAYVILADHWMLRVVSEGGDNTLLLAYNMVADDLGTPDAFYTMS